jgi:hypothetical protein
MLGEESPKPSLSYGRLTTLTEAKDATTIEEVF